MRRPNFRRTLRLESLESREVLSAGGPSAEAQYMLEMINLARTDPGTAAAKFTSNLDADVVATLKYYNVDLNQVCNDITKSPVRPPVAWNDSLATAAAGQAQDQATNGFQSHTGSDGSNVETRLDRAGYSNRVAYGENSYSYSKSVDHAMEAFLIDWGVNGNGHRNNILQPAANPDQYYREVGIGIVKAQNAKVGPMVITQDFGTRSGTKAQVLGVVYNDKNGDGTYDIGEGQGNVEIDAINGSGQTVSTTSWDNGGGYQLALDPGQYTIKAKVNGTVVETDQISIDKQNLQIDYNLSASTKNLSAVAKDTTSTTTVNGTADKDSSFRDSWSSWTL